MPYIIVGDAEGFIRFITDVFAAHEILRVNNASGSPVHCEYSINGGTVMFGQASGEWSAFPCGMFVVVEDVDGLYAKALEHGAASIQAPDDRGYGRAAGVSDPFGNQWWLNNPA